MLAIALVLTASIQAAQEQPTGRVLSTVPIAETRSLIWNEEGTELLVNPDTGRVKTFTRSGKETTHQIPSDEVVAWTDKEFYTFDRKSMTIKRGGDVAAYLPKETITIVRVDLRNKAVCTLFDNGRYQGSLIVGGAIVDFRGSKLYQTPSNFPFNVWDISYEKEQGLCYQSTGRWGLGRTCGVELLRVLDNGGVKKEFDPVQLAVNGRAVYGDLFPKTQTVFLRELHIVRFLVVPAKGFDKAKPRADTTEERRKYSKEWLESDLRAYQLPHTRLEIWEAFVSMSPLRLIASLPGRYPPQCVAVNRDGKYLAMSFADDVVIAETGLK